MAGLPRAASELELRSGLQALRSRPTHGARTGQSRRDDVQVLYSRRLRGELPEAARIFAAEVTPVKDRGRHRQRPPAGRAHPPSRFSRAGPQGSTANQRRSKGAARVPWASFTLPTTMTPIAAKRWRCGFLRPSCCSPLNFKPAARKPPRSTSSISTVSWRSSKDARRCSHSSVATTSWLSARRARTSRAAMAEYLLAARASRRQESPPSPQTTRVVFHLAAADDPDPGDNYAIVATPGTIVPLKFTRKEVQQAANSGQTLPMPEELLKLIEAEQKGGRNTVGYWDDTPCFFELPQGLSKDDWKPFSRQLEYQTLRRP